MIPQEKKDDQKTVDSALLKAIESVPDLKAYLGARFSLKSGNRRQLTSKPWVAQAIHASGQSHQPERCIEPCIPVC